MDDPALPLDAEAEERRFTLSVWPPTPTRAWRAQLSASDPAPALRFERPMDLVLYLTELSTSAEGPPRGLR